MGRPSLCTAGRDAIARHLWQRWSRAACCGSPVRRRSNTCVRVDRTRWRIRVVKRFVADYGIPEYDAEVLSISRALANYYEETARISGQPKAASNWIMGDLLRFLKEDDREIEESSVTPTHIAEMIKLIDNGTISGKIAKTVMEEMYKTGKMPDDVVKEKGLIQVTDTGAIEKVIDEVLAENADSVAAYRSGKDKLFGFFVGQVMKKSQGKGNPAVLNELLKKKLGK